MIWIINVKLLFLALTFLVAIISNGNCASVMVMPSQQAPRLGSLKEAYLRQIEETEKFMQRELEDIRSTLGEEAYKNATSMIESFPPEQINIQFLKAILAP